MYHPVWYNQNLAQYHWIKEGHTIKEEPCFVDCQWVVCETYCVKAYTYIQNDGESVLTSLSTNHRLYAGSLQPGEHWCPWAHVPARVPNHFVEALTNHQCPRMCTLSNRYFSITNFARRGSGEFMKKRCEAQAHRCLLSQPALFFNLLWGEQFDLWWLIIYGLLDCWSFSFILDCWRKNQVL